MYNPTSLLALGKARQRELHEEARRARLIQEARPPGSGLVRRLLAGIGSLRRSHPRALSNSALDSAKTG